MSPINYSMSISSLVLVLLIQSTLSTTPDSETPISSACETQPSLPLNIPKGHILRYNSTTQTHSIICQSTRQEISSLICIKSRWLLSLSSTGQIPDFTNCKVSGNSVIQSLTDKSRQMRSASNTQNNNRHQSNSHRKRVSSTKNPSYRGRSTGGSSTNTKSRVMAYCQKLAKNGYFQSSCPDCQEACEGERESMETTIKQCRKTTTHYRYRLQKIQGHLSNNTSVYQRCKYQLKMKDYEASKLANQISNQDDQIQDLRSKFDHQEEVIADYKTRIESCTGELDTQRNMYNDLRDRMGYEIQQKDEECNQREQDAERHCSDKVNTKNEEVQQYKWDLAEAQNSIQDERHTADYYKQNYEWCTDQLAMLGYKKK